MYTSTGRFSKKKFTFNLLLLGPNGIGKKTFLKNLTSIDNLETNNKDNSNDDDNRSNESIFQTLIQPKVDPYWEKYQLNWNSMVNLNVSILNFGAQINNRGIDNKVKDFLELQLDNILLNEIKIDRDREKLKLNDNRIHLTLFFINGNNSKFGLSDFEIHLLNKIKKLTNIMLVIGKSDRFDSNYLLNLKKKINEVLIKNNIQCFNFGNDNMQVFSERNSFDTSNFIDSSITESKVDFNDSNSNLGVLIKDIHPFAITCGNLTQLEKESNLIKNSFDNNIMQRNTTLFNAQLTRNYFDRTVNIEDTNISDFYYLKEIISNLYLEEFIDTTTDIIYEKFRTEKLLAKQGHDSKSNDHTASSIDVATKKSCDSGRGIERKISPHLHDHLEDSRLLGIRLSSECVSYD